MVGVPPKDLIEDIAAALRLAGIDPDSVFEKCVVVSGEWKYDTIGPWQTRFSNEYIRDRTIPMKHKTAEETLNHPAL